jgi:hypothetical protein
MRLRSIHLIQAVNPDSLFFELSIPFSIRHPSQQKKPSKSHWPTSMQYLL